MRTYILLGEQAVKDFQSNDWESLEYTILENFNGDLVAWDKEIDSVSELLNTLTGWDSFIELSSHDLKEIRDNTKIEII